LFLNQVSNLSRKIEKPREVKKIELSRYATKPPTPLQKKNREKRAKQNQEALGSSPGSRGMMR
jgi:hypothetical protein